MSEIGFYEFTANCELHIVNALGKTCPVNEESVDTELDIACNLHCDDPEDGVYGEDIVATIAGTDIKLSDEAIELLDLANAAGMNFMESGCVPPKVGEKYSDHHGTIWTVLGSGMHHENANGFYTMLQRPVGVFRKQRCMVVDTYVVMHPSMIKVGDNRLPMFRRVIEEDEPTEGNLREMHAVYVGAPKEIPPV